MSSNPWTKYYEAKSQSEKEAVLKKLYPKITEEELEIFRRKLPYPEDAKEATQKKLEWTDEEIMDYAVQLFLDSLPKLDEPSGDEKIDKQRPTWDDFFAATERQDKEAILQKIFGGSLKPEEIEMFFPKDQ